MRYSFGAPVQTGAFSFSVFKRRLVVLLPCLTLYVGLLIIFHIYSFAFRFGSSFDDAWNLSRLTSVHDFHSAMEFIAGGAAGPLGRPVALLSFVPYAASWPAFPEDFLYGNTLLHLLNVLLVFWLTLRLAKHLPWEVVSPAWMALFAALWWGASPLLFSTSIMTVQRMTSLSALFCLAGCLLYVMGWQRLANKPWSGLLMMAVGVGAGTLLAAFSKENGLLLPGLILALDRLLLARSDAGLRNLSMTTDRLYSTLSIVLLWLPVAAVIAYLIVKLSEMHAGYTTRPFTMNERLLTEPRILFDYLRLLLFPVRSDLGPFHDDYLLSQGLLQPLSTIFAITALAVSMLVAWIVHHSSWRMFSFVVAWFLWGHITESSVVPLELYFEHRNYLPAVAVAIGISALFFHPKIGIGARVILVTLLLGSSLFVLREAALLWGDRAVASASWYERHPASLRALQFRLGVLDDQQRFDEYQATINSVASPLRERPEYAMIRLASACTFGTAQEVGDAAALAAGALSARFYNQAVTDVLDKLVDRFQEHGCEGLQRTTIDRMVMEITTNPSPSIRADMRAQAYEIRARLTIADGNLDGTMRNLEEAFRLRPTLSVGIAMAAALTSADLFDDAEKKLDELAAHEPRRPFVRESWRRTVAEMREIVESERARYAQVGAHGRSTERDPSTRSPALE